jgi:hypothetical protein
MEEEASLKTLLGCISTPKDPSASSASQQHDSKLRNEVSFSDAYQGAEAAQKQSYKGDVSTS